MKMNQLKPMIPLILPALLLNGCSTPAMDKAKIDAKDNPELCGKALAEGAVPFESLGIPTENWRYRYTLYQECLGQAIIKNPHICKEVLAAGRPPGATGFIATKQEQQAITEYVYCRNLAGNINNRDNYSRLDLDSIGVNKITGEELKKARFGRIASVQVENLSRPGTQGGAAMGATIGQVAYLENKTINNYSPWSQMGSGLAGAAIGSAIDESPQSRFIITYWIGANEGDFVAVKVIDVASGHLPEGMCVAIIDNFTVKQAPDNKCKKNKFIK